MKKGIAAILLLLLLAGLLGWLVASYHIIDGQLYPKNEEVLDLRGKELTVGKYESIQEKMPETKILWNVPFQQGKLANDVAEIIVTSLSEEDVQILAEYFPNLQTVRGESCKDYAELAYLQDLRPDVSVNYIVELNGTAYPNDVGQVTVAGITEQEIQRLPYLPALKAMTVTGGETDALQMLSAYCREQDIAVAVKLQGQEMPPETETLELEGLTDQEIGVISLLENLKTVHIRYPEATAASLLRLRETCPEVQITWERELCGTVVSSASVPGELDLSETEISSLETLEEELAYFPEVEQIYLGLNEFENEVLAAYRERVREQYKVVWMVQCGPRLTARTDDTSFMPLREGLPTFTDEEIYNLRYCEDMIAIDIGHMKIGNIEFVRFMPNLEYLILAHTDVMIIEPLRDCKKLKFLEVDYTPVIDLSALLDCTALEDLNVGFTMVPLDIVKRMTWLKNLWMIRRSGAEEMAEALPNTTIMAVGNASVANGWRELPNYFAMRDALGMYYMSW